MLHMAHMPNGRTKLRPAPTCKPAAVKVWISILVQCLRRTKVSLERSNRATRYVCDGTEGVGCRQMIMPQLDAPEDEVQGVFRSKVADSRVCHCRRLLGRNDIVVLAARDRVAGKLLVCHHAGKPVTMAQEVCCRLITICSISNFCICMPMTSCRGWLTKRKSKELILVLIKSCRTIIHSTIERFL